MGPRPPPFPGEFFLTRAGEMEVVRCGTLGGMSSSCLSQELRSNLSSRLVMRGGGAGVSEVGSEFWRGISGRWDARPSWKADTPLADWSCRDWEPDMEGLWDFTGTRWAICGSTGRCMGGVRAGWIPPLLKDSDRGGRDGSDIRLATLCWSAGELCRFSLERSSTSQEPVGRDLVCRHTRSRSILVMAGS